MRNCLSLLLCMFLSPVCAHAESGVVDGGTANLFAVNCAVANGIKNQVCIAIGGTNLWYCPNDTCPGSGWLKLAPERLMLSAGTNTVLDTIDGTNDCYSTSFHTGMVDCTVYYDSTAPIPSSTAFLSRLTCFVDNLTTGSFVISVDTISNLGVETLDVMTLTVNSFSLVGVREQSTWVAKPINAKLARLRISTITGADTTRAVCNLYGR